MHNIHHISQSLKGGTVRAQNNSINFVLVCEIIVTFQFSTKAIRVKNVCIIR